MSPILGRKQQAKDRRTCHGSTIIIFEYPSLPFQLHKSTTALQPTEVTHLLDDRDHAVRIELKRVRTLWIVDARVSFTSIMFQCPPQIETQTDDIITCDMDSAQVSTSQSSQPLPLSASSSDTTSSASSFFSKGHSTRSGSNASSIASSPAARESLDIYNSSKRHLTDVKEEPLEQQDADMMEAVSSQPGKLQLCIACLLWLIR